MFLALQQNWLVRLSKEKSLLQKVEFWQEAVDHLQDVFCELVEAECNKLLG